MKSIPFPPTPSRTCLHKNNRRLFFNLLFLALSGFSLLSSNDAAELEYPYAPYNAGKMDPQLTGWPLSKEELEYLAKPSFSRRPGQEAGAQKIAFLPYTPSAEGSGNPNWYVGVQEKFIKVIDQYKKDNGSSLDILLVGDSITWQWIDIAAPYSQYPQKFNEAWQANFGMYKALNLGVAGDKTQGVLWRLDHGGTTGTAGPALNPRLVILAIGHNNMFFSPETGTKNAALGVFWCVKNLRARFPEAHLVVSKILPCANPAAPFYKDAQAINAELDSLLSEERDQKLHVLPDMWTEMTNPDGTLIEKYFRKEEPSGKKIHLSPTDGYQLWASKLKPIVDTLLKDARAEPAQK